MWDPVSTTKQSQQQSNQLNDTQELQHLYLRWLQDDLFYTEMISPRNSHILSFPPRIRSCWGLSTAGTRQLLSLKTTDLSLGPTRRLKQGWGWHLHLHSVFASFTAAQTPAWLCTDMLMTKGCLAPWPSSPCFSAEDPKILHCPKPWSPWIPERTKPPRTHLCTSPWGQQSS